MYLFMSMYIISYILVMSCKDWFLIWLGLEINMISFIMIMFSKYDMLSIESCMKYFFIQGLGSVILLMMLYLSIDMFSYIGSILLCYKIGGGPFYFWFPSVCEGIGWWPCFFLMTFQKFIPLMLISMFISIMVWIMSLMSLIIGVTGSMNQMNMKHLMAFSSIHHIGWMLISYMVSDDFWMIYLMLYTFMILGWIKFLEINMIQNIISTMKFNIKWMMMVILLNLGGIPPLMGFFLKWWSFYYFLMFEFSLMMLMIMFSLIMLYIYFRIIYDFVMGGKMLYSWEYKMMEGSVFQYDIMILMSFCLGSLLGLIYI